MIIFAKRVPITGTLVTGDSLMPSPSPNLPVTNLAILVQSTQLLVLVRLIQKLKNTVLNPNIIFRVFAVNQNLDYKFGNDFNKLHINAINIILDKNS
jgi:hypothetical protein